MPNITAKVSNTSTNKAYVGTSSGGSAFFTGEIADVIVCNDDPTAAQMDQLAAYYA